MFVHKNQNFHVSFGNASNSISSQEHNALLKNCSLDVIARLQESNDLDYLLFLKQVHGTGGTHIQSPDQAQTFVPFGQEGDYLITDLPNIGIGVLTADCVPIVIYAPDKHSISVIHAGWRGAVAGIVPQVIKELCSFGCDVGNLQVFIGPSAKECCYEVSVDFYNNVDPFYHAMVFSVERGKHYFNLSKLLQIQLNELGVLSQHICLDYNMCTMCDHSFYSYRRQGSQAGRNITVVFLKVV